ncbi:MAG: L-serine ammonia-lyase [Bacteroidales bacterium]|jgi:L-serine dehydratase|nr:L-serine ammonia-lyase [Bacteroidales bacterium]MDD3943702.1 L-serine ammonia-lyase [Bacteroidales bacterium]MDD5714099.1 L-serine ammonia-lyase [Bacteroidales bacterium]MDY0358952.1 L-serine ammonia-lyase [Bacteroidales bacterium]NLN37549.1 L-serine ammonia-lyase [Bacteroidales bacterium]
MESIKEIFKIGNGPSSSHTMAPRRAALSFAERNPSAERFSVTLYGSLAATGKGHFTDKALENAFSPKPVDIEWDPGTVLKQHTNGMEFKALDREGNVLDKWLTFSIGGGDLSETGTRSSRKVIYPMNKMADIQAYCQKKGIHFWEYVAMFEEEDIWDYLEKVWQTMKDAIHRGLENEGVLPGPLHLARRAASYHIKAQGYKGSMQRRAMAFSYALAVAEENASGSVIVTAPTCGSCGVIPSVLYLNQTSYNFPEVRILRALATAGLIGSLIKSNASISGAEVGCQGEIGSACSMSAAAGVQLFGGSIAQAEYAASIGMEHFLGLTCDPVCGLVQIPCIERNAFGATRAIDANMYALLSDGTHRISFDTVIETMKRTGHDLPSLYKETSEGGLAVVSNQ